MLLALLTIGGFSTEELDRVARHLGERQSQNYRRMGPMSRPFVRSGQWSQNTAGMFQPAARLSTNGTTAQKKDTRSVLNSLENATNRQDAVHPKWAWKLSCR